MQTVMEIKCAWCGKDMGTKDGKGVTGVSHGICEGCQLHFDLERLSRKRDKLKADFMATLKEDGNIADNTRSYWANLNAGSYQDW